MLHLVQPGRGPSPLVICYFVEGPALAKLVSILGPEPCVVHDADDGGGRFCRTPGKGGVDTLEQTVDFATAHGASFGALVPRIVLIGWSAGCEAVREHLRGEEAPNVDAVIALDGIAGSFPVPTPAQIDPWKWFAGEAREQAHGALFVLTHTTMGYTERIPVGEQGGPFESTTHMAAIVTGTAGETPPATGPISPVEGSLYVCAYPSADISASAHTAQVREVLPDLAKRLLVPWLAATAPAAPQEAEATA